MKTLHLRRLCSKFNGIHSLSKKYQTESNSIPPAFANDGLSDFLLFTAPPKTNTTVYGGLLPDMFALWPEL